MLKRILFIIAYPFILLYKIVSLSFEILYILITDKKGNKRKINSTIKFDIKKVGLLLFPDLKENFEAYLKLYTKDKVEFWEKYKEIQADNTQLSQLELLQSFGDIHQKLAFIDWKGEDDEMEIEEYIQAQIKKEIAWIKSNNLRKNVARDKQRDGKFIVKLLQAIDKDLQIINFRLLFLNMGWDSYIFLPVTTQTFDKVLELAPNQFENADEL